MKSISTHLTNFLAALAVVFGLFQAFSAQGQTVCPVRQTGTNKTCGATSTSLSLNFNPECTIPASIVYQESGGPAITLAKAGGGSCTGTAYFNLSIGCTLAAPFSLSFNAGSLVCNYSAGAAYALPVELAFFEAAEKGQLVQLDWATASERENDFFAIERSEKGIDFETIGRVEGAGDATERLEYGFLDQKPLPGTSYYRLRQVDADGEETLSHVVAVHRRLQQDVSLRPNPAADFVQIDWGTFAGLRSGRVLLADPAGKILFQQAIDAESFGARISLESLASGFYVATFLIDGQAPITRPLVVER